MPKQAVPLVMTDAQRDLLEKWTRSKTIPQRVFFRARICLLAAAGLSNTAVASAVGSCRATVLLWKKRFEELGPYGLTKDAPKGPNPRRTSPKKIREIMDATLNTLPPDGTHWTTRKLAKAQGVSNASIARIWKANGFNPSQRISVNVNSLKISRRGYGDGGQIKL